jgi:pimeloyl-ACP methyl ester carboxylesterase
MRVPIFLSLDSTRLGLAAFWRGMALVIAGGAVVPQVLAAQAQQTVRLGTFTPYSFVVFANADLHHVVTAERAVVLVHGVKRNADDYFQSGQRLLEKAGLTAADTLLLAPNFLNDMDTRAGPDMPLWPRDKWMHGTRSNGERPGIYAFSVLDDLLAYLGDWQRFPQMKEIVMIGHSAGGQLMQRYTVMGGADQALAARGIAVRYVVSSPSSYVYLEDSRLQDGAFKPMVTIMCPSYSRYRYGLGKPPAYLTRQGLSGEQLFRRYAARDVTYLVGALDKNPRDRVMDRTCGANMQGSTRVERQLTYMRYEQFLSAKWGVEVRHRQFQVEGIGHNAARLYASETVANTLFPAR